MCDICHQFPCHPSCPNVPESDPVIICICCEEGIYAGDKYMDLPEGAICEECVRDMNGTELLERLGEKLCTAYEGDF